MWAILAAYYVLFALCAVAHSAMVPPKRPDPPRLTALSSIDPSSAVDGTVANELMEPQSAANNFLFNYGKWCGAGHGGFQDCCNGTSCPSCIVDSSKTPDEMLTRECLNECPPKDDLDRACAVHDACTFSFPGPRHLKCVPQGNFCACDCLLVAQATNAECDVMDFWCMVYKPVLLAMFQSLTDCWYRDPGDSVSCLAAQEIGGIGNFCAYNGTTAFLRGVHG